MLQIYLITSFSITLAFTCSSLNPIHLTSASNEQQFVEKGCFYKFIFNQPGCNTSPYCTRNNKNLDDEIQTFSNTEIGFTSNFQNISSSGLYVCKLTTPICIETYKVQIYVYVSPKNVQLSAHERMDKNLVSMVAPRTNYSCCSNGMAPAAKIVFLLEDELINGSTVTTVTRNHNNPSFQGYFVTEGDSLALNCSSNYPFVASYTWKHEESDKVVASGIIMNDTNITCTEAGHYVCTLNPDNERNSTNVKTNVYVSCLPRQPVNISVLGLTGNKIIFYWSPSLVSGNQTQYIVEWKNTDMEIIGNQTLPVLDKSPPFGFTIEGLDISALSMIGIYGKNENGKTESVIIYTSSKTTDSPAYTNEVVNITTPVIAVGSVALFFAGFLTAVCLYLTKRCLRRFKQEKQAQISAYMHYLPKQEDTTYQELGDVTAKQFVQKNESPVPSGAGKDVEDSPYINIDKNAVVKTHATTVELHKPIQRFNNLYENTT
ncbi:uncharacterized protein LOC117122975 [Anneissia japonica]|uniref:uncharacterized protein LOC117122975 n=1 Tax=Anneissia japonica TaxID=1529436 RepID=UPI00142580EA|nr:uncharacterized protein LOC117122975 [Anneissia japonica]